MTQGRRAEGNADYTDNNKLARRTLWSPEDGEGKIVQMSRVAGQTDKRTPLCVHTNKEEGLLSATSGNIGTPKVRFISIQKAILKTVREMALLPNLQKQHSLGQAKQFASSHLASNGWNQDPNSSF